MQLRLARLAWTGQSECKSRNESLASVTAVSGEPNELAASRGHDLLQRALDHPRCDAEVFGDLRTSYAVAVQRGDRALALGELAKHRAGEPLDLGMVLAIDKLIDGGGRRSVCRLERRAADVDEQFSPCSAPGGADLAMGRRAQPRRR
jgi:hypothetical protein